MHLYRPVRDIEGLADLARGAAVNQMMRKFNVKNTAALVSEIVHAF